MSEVSKKQQKANERNAKKGGVKTEGGKKVSRYNGIKHGILSDKTILEDENESEFNKLLSSLAEKFEPAGPIEQFYIEKIAVDMWRLRRVAKAENSHVNSDTNTKSHEAMPAKIIAEQMEKFARYDTMITNQIEASIKQLRELQNEE